MRLIPNLGVNPTALPAQRLLGTAVLSASALLLEIALTRLFSLIFFPPYVFFIISVAIMGIGAGAALAAWQPKLTREIGFALGSCGAAICALLLSLFAVYGRPVDMQILLFVLAALPFVFFGMVISALFSQHAAASPILYMSDLIGAGCGALLAIPLLNRFGAVNTMLFAALGFALAGLYFSTRRERLAVAICIGVAGVAFAVDAVDSALRIDPSTLAPEKPIANSLAQGGRILETRWDAFARTDLVDPGGGRPLRIYVDGGAASIMPSESARRELLNDIGFFPFATEQPDRVFIIGPGAGLDVWFALQSNASHITAVEVNGASVDLVEVWRGSTGSLYDRAEVEVIVDDGRSALRRSGRKYDLIYLSQVVTLAADRGGYALSENTIYTVEAFSEYLDRLDAGGQIALKLYDEATLTRAVSTAIAAFRQRGLTDERALNHIMAIIDSRGRAPVPLLLVGEAPFSADDSLALGAIARDVGFRPVMLPHVLLQPPLDAIAKGVETFDSIVSRSDTDISPATDDRPYFFQFEKGIPSSLVPLASLSAIVAAGLALSFARRLRRGHDRIQRGYPPFFALLGIGFIAIEIYAIQQTRLFLGHPTFAITLVLATFLVGGGLGSGLSHLAAPRLLAKHPQITTAAVAILSVLWALLWTPLSGQFIAAEPATRGLIALISLLPLALCMGLPFPQALKELGRAEGNQVAFAWCVNGLMTAVGSVAAVTLSIVAGFSAVLWLGGSAYLLATVILTLIHRREAP